MYSRMCVGMQCVCLQYAYMLCSYITVLTYRVCAYMRVCSIPKESFYLSIIFILLSFSHVVLVQLSPHCIQLKNKFVNKMYNMEIVETLYCINSDVMVL